MRNKLQLFSGVRVLRTKLAQDVQCSLPIGPLLYLISPTFTADTFPLLHLEMPIVFVFRNFHEGCFDIFCMD